MASQHFLNLAVAHVDTGNLEEARHAVNDALEKTPGLNISYLRAATDYRSDADWQRLASALRAAGLPDS